ncbi:hypothetical protein Tco_1031270 [Tanacetum coccineum]|uniref:Uncharacterized protein n=1 Tax=Tanacetum coccineum TaxID=301880 RepID=A0ABQ5G9B3_9ASTR
MEKILARKSNRKTRISVSVPDDRYAVSNGSGYAAVSDGKVIILSDDDTSLDVTFSDEDLTLMGDISFSDSDSSDDTDSDFNTDSSEF